MGKSSNRPKSMSGKLYQGRYNGLSSYGWQQLGIAVEGGDNYENPAFKEPTRNAALPFLDGACLAAVGGIKETTHGPDWVSVLYDTQMQGMCCTWSAHAAETTNPAQVASILFAGDVTRFDTPIYSTAEKAEAMDGAVECSMFTVLLVAAIYDVIEKSDGASASAKFLLKSWAELAALLPDDLGSALATNSLPQWRMNAAGVEVRDKVLRVSDAAWVHLAYHNSDDIYTDGRAKPFKAEIDVALRQLNRPKDDLAGFIKDTDFLNGLAVRAGFKDVRLT